MECTLCGVFGDAFIPLSQVTENYEGCPIGKMSRLQKFSLAHVFH
jgi:hypothetical protein